MQVSHFETPVFFGVIYPGYALEFLLRDQNA
jgi:hypothetical protein